MKNKKETKSCMNSKCKRKALLVRETPKYKYFDCLDCGCTWNEPKNQENKE